MPGDAFRTKPHSGKKGLAPVKTSKPKSPPKSAKVKAPTGGVSPGAKGGNMTGLIGQPSVSRTPHITKRSQLPKGDAPKKFGSSKGSKRGKL